MLASNFRLENLIKWKIVNNDFKRAKRKSEGSRGFSWAQSPNSSDAFYAIMRQRRERFPWKLSHEDGKTRGTQFLYLRKETLNISEF